VTARFGVSDLFVRQRMKLANVAPRFVERGANASAQDRDGSDSTSPEEDGISAALLEDLTIQRTAAPQAEIAARPDIALVAVTHNLAAQVFYEQFYSLPIALTIRSETYTDRVDLRSAAESSAAISLTRLTEAVRKHLPDKIDDLWQWLLDQPQNVLLNVLAAAAAYTVNAVQGPHDEPSSGRLGAAKDLAKAVELDMANWWQASADNYFGRGSPGHASSREERKKALFSSLTLSETELGGLGGNGWPNERARDGRHPKPDPKTVREQRTPDAG
jgi:hypothetical protein